MRPSADRAQSVPSGLAAKVVVAAVVVAGAGLAAAQLGVLPVLNGGSGDAIDQVPDGVDSVTKVDPGALEDDGLNRLYVAARNETLERTEESGGSDGGAESEEEAMPGRPGPDLESIVPANLTAVGDEVENRTGLDPTAADEVVAYQKQRRNYTAPTYSAAIVHADWNRSDVLQIARNQSFQDLQNTTVNGTIVYQPVTEESEDEEMPFGPTAEQWIAVLDDDEFVFGTEPAVRDAIAVANGNHSSVDGALAEAYRDTRDGYVKYAQRAPNVNISQLEAADNRTGVNLTKYAVEYNSVHVTSGAFYTTDSGVGSVTTMETNTTSAARDVESIYSGLISIQAGAIQNETIESELRSVSVERDGQTVTVSRETSYENAEIIIDWYVSLFDNDVEMPGAGMAPVV